MRERHRALVADLVERAYENAREFDHVAGECIDISTRKEAFLLFDAAFYAARMGAALCERLTKSLEREPAQPSADEEDRPRLANAVAATHRSAEPEREREREPVTFGTFMKSMEALDRKASAFCKRGLGIPEPPAFIHLREALVGVRTALARPADAPVLDPPPREPG